MKVTLCTLFNVNYLDKGLVLYESLERVCSDFVLYVLAMDDQCYDILKEIDKKHMSVIKLSEFETKKLKDARSNRSFGQYCYTCSSSLIKYVFNTYNEAQCAYVDADMCFYADPSVLFDEMNNQNASALVVGHRFARFNKDSEKIVGRYCVQFNPFKNDTNGNLLLDIWISQCLITCKSVPDGIHWGDQMYIDDWCEKYDFVVESKFYGAGVAPWNISQYKHSCKGDAYISYKGNDIPFIFYHFENITYLTEEIVCISAITDWGVDIPYVRSLYSSYLKEITRHKLFLKERFNLEYYPKHHPAAGDAVKPSFYKRLLVLLNPFNWMKIFFFSIPARIYSKHNIIKIQDLN